MSLLQYFRRHLRSPLFRVLAGAVLSAVTWFCWAWFANREHPDQALVSGLTQGSVNFITTAFGSAMLEFLFVRLGHFPSGRLICVLAVSSMSLSIMIIAHIHAGTPNLLLTVGPVYLVVLLYCSSYILSLHKLKSDVCNPVATH